MCTKPIPQLAYCPKEILASGVRYKRKATKVDDIRRSQGKRRWRRVEIKDSSKGLMVAEYLHKRVGFWDHEHGGRPGRWHLLIRWMPKEDGKYLALNMLADLYVLNTKLENRGEFPLLSITDVRDILAYFLPRKVITCQDLMYRIAIRRLRRESSYDSTRRRSLRWAFNRWGGYVTK